MLVRAPLPVIVGWIRACCEHFIWQLTSVRLRLGNNYDWVHMMWRHTKCRTRISFECEIQNHSRVHERAHWIIWCSVILFRIKKKKQIAFNDQNVIKKKNKKNRNIITTTLHCAFTSSKEIVFKRLLKTMQCFEPNRCMHWSVDTDQPNADSMPMCKTGRKTTPNGKN